DYPAISSRDSGRAEPLLGTQPVRYKFKITDQRISIPYPLKTKSDKHLKRSSENLITKRGGPIMLLLVLPSLPHSGQIFWIRTDTVATSFSLKEVVFLIMSTGSLRKRSREEGDDDEDEAQPSKKREFAEEERDLLRAVCNLEGTVRLAHDLVSSLQTIAAHTRLGSKHVSHLDPLRNRLSLLARTCGDIKPDRQQFAFDTLTAFETDFPEAPPVLTGIFSKALSTPFAERLMIVPSANTYAQATVWPAWQNRSTAVLNLRPSQNQGLPLSTLHTIFAEFRGFMADPLPKTDSLPAAYQTAYNLCLRMADSFPDAGAHRNEFQNHSIQFL
ncbi:17086_t:CDS:2, partial [Acaulospora colombiana]